MKKKAFWGLFGLALLAACLFRVTGLGLRPMHHDEANQALKFGALLEDGEYRYDKADHHGPSLYYLSLPLARILSGNTLAALSEETLRLVTACFGLGTLLLLLLLTPAAGRPAVFWSALCLALSPAMVYFSRFYIQETLLVFFLAGFIASLWRYVLSPSAGWALVAGIFAGMMYATKETSVVAFAAVAFAAVLIFSLPKKGGVERGGAAGDAEQEKNAGRDKKKNLTLKNQRKRVWLHALLFVVSALIVSSLLFTSFFKNSSGFFDSLCSFSIYYVRAGEEGFHVHPWFYYLKLLAFSKNAAGPAWTEAFILILAAAGSAAAFMPRRVALPNSLFLRFIFFYTLAATAVFSFIPYKTPWNLLPFHVGFILLAGCGAAVVLDACRDQASRIAVLALLAAGFFHLGYTSYRTNFAYPADSRNPYVYAQTSPDFLRLVRRVEDIASVHPDGHKMLINVIADPYETWPLPWNLRKFRRVGYWQNVESAGALDSPPLIISSASEALKLEPGLMEVYQSEYYELRPGVLLVLYVRGDLWEEFLKASAKR